MVFVTGATGLLGSHLLYFLTQSGEEVLALRRPASQLDEVHDVFRQYTGGDELWHRVNWLEGNVLKPEGLSEAVKSVSCVYHCAAVVSFHGGDKACLMQTNCQGSENLAKLCFEYHVRLCYVSSIAALGDASRKGERIDEETPERREALHSAYSHSKWDAEKIIWQYVNRGLNVVIVNPSIILGAGLWGRSSTRLFLTAAKGIPFYTGGTNGYVDVRDVCTLMIRLAGDDGVRGERFVLNGGNYSYKELFTAIARSVGHRPPCVGMAPWFLSAIWRLLAGIGKITGKKQVFTRETARTASQKSYYSAAKILVRYPDFHFYSLKETVTHISAYL